MSQSDLELRNRQLKEENDRLRAAAADPDRPTTLLAAAAEADRPGGSPEAPNGGSPEAPPSPSAYVLNDDGAVARFAVRVPVTDDDGNQTFETRFGRLVVGASGALSIEYPQPAQEGGNS